MTREVRVPTRVHGSHTREVRAAPRVEGFYLRARVGVRVGQVPTYER